MLCSNLVFALRTLTHFTATTSHHHIKTSNEWCYQCKDLYEKNVMETPYSIL